MYELIITEKPNAAKKIADALADNKPEKKSINKVPYYELSHSGKDIVVGCAVGHLYGLAEKEKKKGWTYPVFDIKWAPISETSKTGKFSKKYLNALKKISKDADRFTVATDYDVEGEVIGLNVVRYVCKKEDAKRMKFSTLTKPDIIKAYENASSHIDWGQAEAGLTRHKLDWYYGINLTRALSSAIKAAGMFKILSIGRVQGPALKIIAEREKEIKAFKPVPFWQIELNAAAQKGDIAAWHKKDKFWEKEKARKVMEKVKPEKSASVSKIERKQFRQSPPVPFDLTALQIEAYRCIGSSPKDTLEMAQDLYTGGFISYPRTSSQKLPKEIGYEKIIKSLAKQKAYSEISKALLKGELKPNEGKKTDPAHPAIYPTGIAPKVEGKKAQLYDLIVRRFLATFGEPALRETMSVELDVKGEIFAAKGTRTVEKGWHVYYGPYVKLEENELPQVKKGEALPIRKITLHEKETQPPKRYTDASIIKELEKRNLGTKATRAHVIDTLKRRDYITGKQIEATELGIQTIKVLEKYAPRVVDEELTRSFEERMEQIREKKQKGDDILEKAKDVLKEILAEFKKKEGEIGPGLKEKFTETDTAMRTVGKCPVCKEGTLMVRKGKFGRFIACDRYPECKTTFKLPSAGMIKVGGKKCEVCGFPMVTVIKKAKKPQDVCINPDCPSKAIKTDKEGKPCPRCGKGKLILRKSVYGSFLACDQYPKCRYIESPEQEKKKGEKPNKGEKKSKEKQPDSD